LTHEFGIDGNELGSLLLPAELDERVGVGDQRHDPSAITRKPARRYRFGYGKSACASSQRRRTISPAGSGRARAAAWPAQACMRWTSPARVAASRIGAVRPRWTG